MSLLPSLLTTTKSESSYSPVSPRPRIRFAPLPDPRRAVLVTEEGTELPIVNFTSDASSCNIDCLDNETRRLKDGDSTWAISMEKLSSGYSIPAAVSLAALEASTTPAGSPRVSTIAELVPSTPPSSAAQSLQPQKPIIQISSSTSSHSSNSSSNSSSSSTSSEYHYASQLSSQVSSMHSLTPTQSNEYPPISPSASILSHSAGSHTPTQSRPPRKFLRNVTADQVLTLGAINLFRTSSRLSQKESAPSAWGHPLERWSSTASFGSFAGKSNGGSGVPMERTQSTQSYKGDNVRSKGLVLSNLNPFASSSNLSQRRKRHGSNVSSVDGREAGLIATVHSGERKPVTKMLNGRVYGAKRGHAVHASNPFANVRDEPEFVEWGYGGAGSVKTAGHGGAIWSKVQSSSGFAGSNVSDDLDDGSGMAWIKRRKEQRLQREAEEKAKELEESTKKLEAEVAKQETDILSPATSDSASVKTTTSYRGSSQELHRHTPSLGSVSTIRSPPSILSVHSPPEAQFSPPLGSALSTPTLSSTSSHLASPGEEGHVLTAVKIPAPMHRRSVSSVHHDNLVGLAVEEHIESEESASSSDEEDDAEDKKPNYDEEEDEEDEDEDEDEEQRKTSLGAGVEKISRHKQTNP